MGGKRIKINVGDVFSDWTVIEERLSIKSSKILCKCTCGNDNYVSISNLRSGKSTKCRDCYHLAQIADMTGQRFGKLTAITRTEKTDDGWYWLFLCDCGNEKEILGSSVRACTTVSCGCHNRVLIAIRNTSHGLTKSPTYKSWNAMLSRCRNGEYSKLGITICDRWLPESGGSFENFLEDMGPRPDETSIDRVDTLGNYEPENCRWSSSLVQVQNRMPPAKSISGKTGVAKVKDIWRANITINGNRITKEFRKLEDAIKYREELEIKYWGFLTRRVDPATREVLPPLTDF